MQVFDLTALSIQPGSQYMIPAPRPLGIEFTILAIDFIQVTCPAAENGIERSEVGMFEVLVHLTGQSVSMTTIFFL